MVNNTILYAEDDKDLRETTLEFFKYNFPDYNIESFETGALLERRLEGGVNGVCAVLTDNQMPGINGSEIIDKHASQKGFPFILFYAGDEKIGQDLARKYNNVQYVQKPDIGGLIDTLRCAINSTPSSQ